jgi:putative ABC transport system permease protein
LITILKGKSEALFKGKKAMSIQSLIVIFQFTIAVILIIAAIGMQLQMNFISNKNLGLQKEQILVLPVRNENIQENFSVLKNKLLKIKEVQDVSAISNFPWEKGFYDFETTINNNGNVIKANAQTLLVEENIISTLSMEMIKGRGFSKDYLSDSEMAFIMNETAATEYGISDPKGVKIVMQNISSHEAKEGNLIGIVKDFHLQSLHEKVAPLILTISPESYFTDNIVVKLTGTNISESIASIESQLKEIAPNRPFEFFFLNDAFDKLYQKEKRVSSLFQYFSILAIIIACLGLLGIVAFATAQRLKEIGIRKVLGASVIGIVELLTTSFLKLVLTAIVISVPLAWLLMSKWLEDFAYRITMHWWIFLVAGTTAMLIAILTICYQAIKAAIANPVKSLRTE